MKLIISILTTLALCLILSQASVGQLVEVKHIPFFSALNPGRLAMTLTRNVKSDTEKVRIIHDWIANNIKYDVKKWLSYSYAHVSTKKILWKRKAICEGYSELFAEMCKAAGVNCVIVPGYDKDISVNVGDNFYFDEHAWNAVEVENGWKLVDVCWDAGSIALTRRTFKGFFVHLFSGGRKDIQVYHPHYVKGGNEFYCLRDGKFFLTDHLPLNPLWQLHYPEITMQQYVNDSAYYYKEYDAAPDGTDKNTDNEYQRRAFLDLSDEDKLLQNALQGYAFNHRNHFQMCVAYVTEAQNLLKALSPYDTTGVQAACDSVIKLVSMAISHSDTMRIMIQKQKTERTANNNKKKAILTQQNKALLNSTKNVLHDLGKAKSIASKNAKAFGAAITSRNNLLKTSYKSNTFYTKKSAVKAARKDSLGYAVSLRFLTDSMKREEARIQREFASADSLYSFDQRCLLAHAVNLNRIINNDYMATYIRYSYYDDLDYEIRKPKDSLILNKNRNDSLLYLNKKEFLFSPLFEKLAKIQEGTTILMNDYKIKLQLYVQYKTFCEDGSALTIEYQQTLKDMATEIDSLNEQGRKYDCLMQYLSNDLGILTNNNKEEQKAYNYEKTTEQYFGNMRRKYINEHAAGLMNATKEIKSMLSTGRAEVKKYTQELKKMRRKKK